MAQAKRKNERLAARMLLEREVKVLNGTVEDKDDVEWEDIIEAYDKVVAAYEKVSRTHLEFMEKSNVEELEEDEGETWMEEVDAIYKGARKSFKKTKKDYYDQNQAEHDEAKRKDLREDFDSQNTKLQKENNAIREMLTLEGSDDEKRRLMKEFDMEVRGLSGLFKDMMRLSVGGDSVGETRDRKGEVGGGLAGDKARCGGFFE